MGGSGHVCPCAGPQTSAPRRGSGRRLPGGCPLQAGPALTSCLLTPACPPGAFGENCGQKCQCPGEDQACHPASGACVCAAGYHGAGCQQRECARAARWALGKDDVGGRGLCEPPLAPGSWPLPLQGARPGGSGPAVSSRVGVSTGAPVTRPQGPATAHLGSSERTAALVSGQGEGRGSSSLCLGG